MPPRVVRRGANVSAYRSTLNRTRSAGFALTRAAVERLKDSFRTMARRIASEESAGIITGERANALRSEVRGMLRAIEDEIAAAARDGVVQTARTVFEVHQRTVRRLLARAELAEADRVLASFNTLNVRAMAVIAARAESASTFRTLARRNVAEAYPVVDRLISSGVARGVSTRRLAKDLAYTLAGGDPTLLDVEAVDLGLYALRDSDVAGFRTLWYDARRIAVSETNNALRESNALALTMSPLVGACKWQLSGRHEALGIVCECDALAVTDAYGFGPGYYPPDRWPQAPHPFCACTQGEPLLRPVAEWGTPKQPSSGPLGEYAIPVGDLSERAAARLQANTRELISGARLLRVG